MTAVSTTGLSEGDFDTLRVLKDGLMQDILTLLNAGGGLSSTQASALIAAALTSYTNTTALGVLLNTKADLTYLAAMLATYTNTSTLTKIY